MFKNGKSFLVRMEKRLKNNAKKNVQRALVRSTNEVRNQAVESIMRGSKSGGAVIRYNPRREHIRSAGGEAPASDTGFLVSQISTEVKMSTTGGVGSVVSAAPYSAPLEFGTSVMEARPFLQPALRKSRRKIESIFRQQGIV
ncbi:MAG: hypothetical protein CBD88_01240 [Flavobacteriales bacterium TMED228]|nr:MAG: hypothetical protein CBD88_01240 [Flavobacteriales bacterium TMED228]|tara:strand:- start:45 stop:470 length:426 start_codon:yes stop_codon:yes gene_type:complete